MLSLRRQTAFASAALVLAAALSSCGFDPATDRENDIAVGATDTTGDLKVLGLTIVAAESGEAVMIGGLSNGANEDENALVSAVAEGRFDDDTAPPTIADFEPITVGSEELVQLQEQETPVAVEGELAPGRNIRVTLSFQTGDDVTVNVPVMRNCGPYAEVPGVPAGESECDVPEAEDH